MISHGKGLLVIPENKVPEFKKLLVEYYEGEDLHVIASFMRDIVGALNACDDIGSSVSSNLAVYERA